MQNLIYTKMTQREAADRLNTTPRTIQRRLKKLADDPGHTYQQGDEITEEIIEAIAQQPTKIKREPSATRANPIPGTLDEAIDRANEEKRPHNTTTEILRAKKKNSFSEEFERRRRENEERKKREEEQATDANTATERKIAAIFTEPRTRFFLLILILSDSLYSSKIAFESIEGIYSYAMATALFFVGGAIGYTALMNIASYTGRDREAWQWGFMIWQFTLHGCGMETFGNYSLPIGQTVIAIGAAMATAAASLTLNKAANK